MKHLTTFHLLALVALIVIAMNLLRCTTEPEAKRDPADPLWDTKPARTQDGEDSIDATYCPQGPCDTVRINGQLYYIDDPKPPKP